MYDLSPITLHKLNSSNGIMAGFWDKDSSDYLEAFQPHRHDHYTCLLLQNGEMEVLLDFEHFVMPNHTLFISYPGQIHQVVKSDGASGWYISFDNYLLEKSVRATLDTSLTAVISVQLDKDEFKWFKSIIGSLVSVDKINLTAHEEVSKPLLAAFVAQAGLIYKSKADIQTSNFASRPVTITKKFRNLVKYNYRVMKRPSDYAEKLNICVSYLNDTVKNITGLTTSEIIQKEIIAEAQRMLYYTSLSVKEISEQLGYDDTKYFMRLFKKITGLSPTQFRKQG